MPTETAPAAPEKDLWQSILHQVSTQTTSRRLGSKTLLVLGDEGSGKSTLIARLQGRKHNTEESPQGTGLEYTYLDVKEEEGGEADVVTRLGVYSLDGNVDHKTLLSFVLNKETVRNTSVLIVVDMARPWLMSDSLNKWAIILEDHMKTIGLEDEVLQEMKTALVKRFQSYTEEATSSGAENREKHPEEGEDTTVLLPLDEGVFTKNIGLPITVVCTKTDSSVSLEKDRDYRSEHFDFIQLYLRRFCVTYGAALFYSGKEGKTKDALYKYILHNAYGLPFNVKAGAPERDIVVIPSGWDNLKKISLLYDGLKTFDPNEPFSTYIMAPAPHKFNTGKEVEVEEEQDFLRRQQVLLNQAGKEDSAGRRPTGAAPGGLAATPAPATAAATPSGAPRGSPNTARSTKVTAPAAATGPVAATPAPAGVGRGGPQNSDVLANFFNSLLNKKPPAGKKEDEKPAA